MNFRNLRYLSFVGEYTTLLGDIIPCDTEDIKNLEYNLKLKLPQAYKEFLLIMGQSGANFKNGSDFSFEYLPLLKEEANEIIENDTGKILPNEAFVFLVHRNYMFFYFIINGDDNPEIYFYIEGDFKEPLLVDKSFSKYIERSLKYFFFSKKGDWENMKKYVSKPLKGSKIK